MQLMENIPGHGLQTLGLESVFVEVVRQAIFGRVIQRNERLANFISKGQSSLVAWRWKSKPSSFEVW